MSTKTEKDLVMEKLDALNVQYSKRTSLPNLKKLLEESQPDKGEDIDPTTEPSTEAGTVTNDGDTEGNENMPAKTETVGSGEKNSPKQPEVKAVSKAPSIKESPKGYLKNQKTGAVFEQTKALKARGDLVPATFEDYCKFKGA